MEAIDHSMKQNYEDFYMTVNKVGLAHFFLPAYWKSKFTLYIVWFKSSLSNQSLSFSQTMKMPVSGCKNSVQSDSENGTE